MTETIIKVDKMRYDPCILFHGTDEEIETADRIHEERKQFFYNLISCDRFQALQIEPATAHDSTRILHHSTRPGYDFQLSFISYDNIPEMHENILNRPGSITACNNMTYLINELANLTLHHDRTIKILYSKGAKAHENR